jgi:2-polyprenyl-3-methyl-5-hydroxy-6-metoxy-1,4-benzoquinol methylase
MEPEENFDLITDPFMRIDKSGRFRLDDIPLILETYRLVANTLNTAWDHFRGKHLVLPEWFKTGLDPLSDEYFAQQMRLWNVLADVDRDYVANLDEAEVQVPDVDAIRRPGFYIWRNDPAVQNASDHVLATGMLMKHSGLKPGMWALEYGAGFAQTALAFARMGVNVDTVDISTTFCGYVKEQAEFFRVNLTPFKAHFGDNPRGDQKYDLIWFFESFHHCVDFKNVVAGLKAHLTPTGKILLAGEPITKRENPAVPYPWGLRLESEVVAVIRNLHWFEMGFSEDFITNFFTNNGYSAEYFDCPMSIYGQVYSFTSRTARIELGTHWLPTVDEEGWHAPDPTGRWTRALSSMALDQSESFDAIEITATNHHPKIHPVSISYGGVNTTVNFDPGERKTIRIEAKIKSPKITFACETIVPGGPGLPSNDTRALGIYLHYIDYLP